MNWPQQATASTSHTGCAAADRRRRVFGSVNNMSTPGLSSTHWI
jgi:hypothetical protein